MKQRDNGSFTRVVNDAEILEGPLYVSFKYRMADLPLPPNVPSVQEQLEGCAVIIKSEVDAHIQIIKDLGHMKNETTTSDSGQVIVKDGRVFVDISHIRDAPKIMQDTMAIDGRRNAIRAIVGGIGAAMGIDGVRRTVSSQSMFGKGAGAIETLIGIKYARQLAPLALTKLTEAMANINPLTRIDKEGIWDDFLVTLFKQLEVEIPEHSPDTRRR